MLDSLVQDDTSCPYSVEKLLRCTLSHLLAYFRYSVQSSRPIAAPRTQDEHAPSDVTPLTSEYDEKGLKGAGESVESDTDCVIIQYVINR